mmetsp:Transcript_9292/g.15114  ORF Transcript_9292/g.15114 Transcript_9292/m.15114 type:complete len:520 (+) Transcript_9292:150-1709(+)|eukprot:CAMPEP_0203746342 /NCGR_PEP_ID=MMETSP0098-20131031/1797_1 /ASSEMBLY_ACC=CAM_ASM_000208 /TAXON_ID=96639 /ORGANISM=" , Strain NY0313808BC1" /LENGTH=519 /DNA_ID=CAMNT_0050634411 /DNA_START=157 /DNA_END=1716 /DNA_ORIENTATION=-
MSDSSLPPFAQTKTSMIIVSSFSTICFFMYLGHFLREWISCTRRIMLPAALIGGALALLVIQLCSLNTDVEQVVANDFIAGWGELPGFLINIIFATLFMGSRIPSVGELWKWAGPQLAYGQVLAWGNWVFACLFCSILFMPAFDTHELFGSLAPVGLEGGHGTAAGLKDTYETLGFADGYDLAVTSATIGILAGVIFGTVLCNIGNKFGWTYSSYKLSLDDDPEESVREHDGDVKVEGISPELGMGEPQPWRLKAVIPENKRVPGSYLSISNDAIDTLALHVGFVGLAVMLAYWTKRGLMALETTSAWLTEYKFFNGFPLFPICMLWGLVIQICIDRFCTISPLDRGTMERIGGVALDFLVLAAIATTKLDVVADSLGPLILLLVLVIAWQLACFFFLAPMMLPDFWFERAIAEAGKSLGTTSIGLMLLRIVDPNLETPAMKAFSCKQMFNEPFMGGGLWTSLALPLIASVGNFAVMGIGCGFILFWMVFWFFVFRPQKVGKMIQYKFDPKTNIQHQDI